MRAPVTALRRAVPVTHRRVVSFVDLIRRVEAQYGPRVATAYTQAVLKHQRSVSTTALRTAIASGNVDRIAAAVRPLDLQRDVLRAVGDPLTATSRAAGAASARVLEANGVAAMFNATDPEVARFARAQGAQLVRDVPASTKAVIAEVIARGAERGLTVDQQARAIREVVGLPPQWAGAPTRFADDIRQGREAAATSRRVSAASQQEIRNRIRAGTVTEAFIAEKQAEYARSLVNARARRIARTETSRAAHHGVNESWRQAAAQGALPPSTRRFWIVTPDERLSLEHARIPAMNPKGRKLDEPFVTTEGLHMYPPSRPHCRCSVGLAFGRARPQDASRAAGDEMRRRRDVRAPRRAPQSAFGDAPLTPVRRDVQRYVDPEDATASYARERSEFGQWRTRLAPPEARALDAFQNGGRAGDINAFVRDGTVTPQAAEHATQLTSALASSAARIPDGRKMWHAMTVPPGQQAELLKVLRAGSGTVTEAGFIAASPSSTVAAETLAEALATADAAATPVLMRVTTRGARGAFVQDGWGNPQYVLQRGANIRVTAVTRHDSGLLFVEAEIGHAEAGAVRRLAVPTAPPPVVSRPVPAAPAPRPSALPPQARPVAPSPRPSTPAPSSRPAASPPGDIKIGRGAAPTADELEDVRETLLQMNVDPSVVTFEKVITLEAGTYSDVGFSTTRGVYHNGKIRLTTGMRPQMLRHVAAHEAQHLRFDVVWNRASRGGLSKSAAKLRREVLLDREGFAMDDGVTAYSRAHWRKYLEKRDEYYARGVVGDLDLYYKTALNETLAEIAGLQTTGVVTGTPRYRALLAAIETQYNQVARSGPGVAQVFARRSRSRALASGTRGRVTPAQVKVLKEYTQRGLNHSVNGLLRGVGTKSSRTIAPGRIPRIQQAIATLDEALANAPTLRQPLVLWRGDSSLTVGRSPVLPTGHRFVDKGFVSTSRHVEVAQRFSGRVPRIYKITVPKNVRALPVPKSAAYQGREEAEVILQRNLQFRVKRTRQYTFDEYQRKVGPLTDQQLRELETDRWANKGKITVVELEARPV